MSMSDGEVVKLAERGLIGLGLIQPAKVLELDVEPHHFFDLRWQSVWGVMRDLVTEGRPVDEVTVAERLNKGDAVLLELGACALGPIPILPEHYADIVRQGWVTRQVLGVFSQLTRANSDGVEGGELLDLALERLAAIHVEQPPAAISIGELAKARYLEIVARAEARAKGEPCLDVPTGLPGLDEIMGGLQPGVVTVVAGRPGMGKSAFAMGVVDCVSRLGLGAHVFSLEDTRSAYGDRSLSRESGISAEAIRANAIEWPSISTLGYAAQRLHDRRGWLVDDRSGITAEEVVRSVRRELKANATRLVVVDYVQLLRPPPGMSNPSDRTKVTDHAINVLADAAKQDDIAYLVLAQLNRECEKRDNKRPLLADLKQSGAIEERAKAVLMLYRPIVYGEIDPQTRQPYPAEWIELLLRKHNQGRTGKVVARWDGPTTRID
jgi:replicative DNA helicase